MSGFLRLELSGSVSRHTKQRRQWASCQKETVRVRYAGDSPHVTAPSVRSASFANLDKANRTYGVRTLKGSQHELYGGN